MSSPADSAAPVIDADSILRLIDMSALIEALRVAFQSGCVAPTRHHHSLSEDGTLLLMPAWRRAGALGVKVATVHRKATPAVNATYLLIDGETGRLQAIIDGGVLTSLRTAAASALAADYLAREDAETLLILGTGTLVPFLIQGHRCVRNIQRVMIWGRDHQKAETAAEQALSSGIAATAVKEIDTALSHADIVSAATLSRTALIRGALLRAGTHVDLIGAFKADMCEADPQTFAGSRVFVDTREGALHEAGDLLQAIEAKAFSENSIEADLAELCSGKSAGRGSDRSSITVFKSVGAALEDLAAAELIHDAWVRADSDHKIFGSRLSG